MTVPHPGEIAALATAFCWTFTALAFEYAGKRIGSLSVNIIRLVIAFVFLTIFCACVRGRPLPTDAPPEVWLWLGLSGIIGFTLGDMCLFRALVTVGSRLATLMMALVPPMAALVGWIAMGETLGIRHWIGMGVTIAGVVLVVLDRGGNGQAAGQTDKERRSRMVNGLLLGFVAAASQAVGLVFSKLGTEHYDPFAATQVRVIAGTLGFALLFVFIGWWPRVIAALRDRPAILRTGFGAFFGPFLGVSLSLVAVKYTATGIAATIMSITPVLIIPATAVVQKEKITWRAIVGAVIAVGGTAVMFL